MKAITVEALSKTFSGGTVAVDGIRFSLNQGEIFGFLGPNGAGKTTTVKLLCGMLTPSGGKCQVLGIDPTQNPEQLHKKVGVVTEHAQMYFRVQHYHKKFIGGKYNYYNSVAIYRKTWYAYFRY